MKKYLKQAKDEGLNWQTALIEDTETEIKLLIRAAVFGAWAWTTLNRKIVELVNKTAEEIEIEELKERARVSLLAFATIAYRTFAAAMSGVNVKILPQVVKYTERGDKSAERLLRKSISGGYFDTAQPLNIYAKDYMAKVQGALDELAQSTAKDDYSSRVSLRNISEMSVRWEEKQKARQKLIDDGEDIVWISTHANCSVRCQKYQGRLYSMSNQSGVIDGIKYDPLSDATDVFYTTKSGKTYKNGCISGYNCRHYLIPYRKGNRPFEVPADVVEKQRKINRTQRAMERGVRDARLVAELSIGKDAQKAKKVAAARYKCYREYCKRNNVAYYPSRVQIWDSDVVADAWQESQAIDEGRKPRRKI